ncbi:MAG: ATP-binding protein [Polyangiales bacterium]
MPRSLDVEERFRVVADYTYDWESWIGPDGRTEWVNPAVERLTGYTVAECLAMPDYPLAIVHVDDRPRLSEVLRSAARGTSGNDLEFRVRRKDGAERWVAISWQPIFASDGRCLGYRSSVRDIHERKRFERRLRDAQERAELAARAKSDFLAHLSHELRTPLQCIAGFAELLGRTPLDDAQRRWLGIVEQQSSVILRQMEDLLHFASLDAAPPALESRPLDLEEVGRSAVEALHPKAVARGLELAFRVEAGAPRLVRGDAARIGQILANLLGNAVKFTERGRVSLVLAPAAGGKTRFRVEDTGIGIPAEDLEAIFEPFAQANREVARRLGGVGLGLAIADRLAHAMGGAIALASVVGEGTTVDVTLDLPPASREELAGPSGAARPTPGLEEARPLAATRPLEVLVVDDSGPARELAVEMLKALGYAPVEARGGEEAIELVGRHPFDVVLMDYQMPDLDGVTATQMIRAQQPQGTKPPFVVLLTANVFADPGERGEHHGIDVVLTKPIRLSQLREVLAHAFEGTAPHLERAQRRRDREVLDATVLADLEATRTSDGRTMLARIGGRVLAEMPVLLDELARRRGELAATDVARLAHQAKGTCLVVGARRAAREAERLEQGVERLDPEAALAAALDRLRDEWARAGEELRRRVDEP